MTDGADPRAGLAPQRQTVEATPDFAPGLERAFALEVEPGSFPLPTPAGLPAWLLLVAGTALWMGYSAAGGRDAAATVPQ